MSEIRTVQVTISWPGRRYPLGTVEDGYYRVEDGVVSLVTRDGAPRTDMKGKPIQEKILPNRDAHEMAGILVKRHMPRRHSDFNRPLYYPRRGKI